MRFHYFCLSNRDVVRVSPDSDMISLRILGGCCTKGKESITNQFRICRMQHELGTN